MNSVVTDSTELTDALKNNFDDVELLLEKVMAALDNKVSSVCRYIGLC